jgi:electron transfer flavoprotein alpha/beta subunit
LVLVVLVVSRELMELVDRHQVSALFVASRVVFTAKLAVEQRMLLALAVLAAPVPAVASILKERVGNPEREVQDIREADQEGVTAVRPQQILIPALARMEQLIQAAVDQDHRIKARRPAMAALVAPVILLFGSTVNEKSVNTR